MSSFVINMLCKQVAFLFALTPCSDLSAKVHQAYYVKTYEAGARAESGGLDWAHATTIDGAKQKVRDLPAPWTGDVHVILAGGTYYYGATLNFSAQDSGKSGYKVIYRNNSGEIPVFSGGKIISGSWMTYNPSWHYIACTNSFRELTTGAGGADQRAVLAYEPPVKVEAFCRERARLTGVSDAIRPSGDYQVIVAGAGPAGVPAALAAARQGMRVALVSDRPVLGGNASHERGVPVQGAAAKQHTIGRETGIIEEAGRIMKAKDCGWVLSHPFREMIEAEKNLDLFENAWLEDAVMEGQSIQKVILRDTLTGERKSLKGDLFIDCTGDGWLGHHAGADFHLGREARSEHNESAAPEKADRITMSGCLRGPSSDLKRGIFYNVVRENSPQPFTPPPWIYELPENWIDARKPESRREFWAKTGTWWYEHPGEVDDLWQPEFARDQLFRVVYTAWNFWKNEWEERGKVANYRLEYIPFMVGKRETRRLLGDYILTQNDCEAGRRFPDAIGHYGWTMDLHAPQGILDLKGFYDCDIKVPQGHIPYRCLYSRNVDNLLMAGRNISVTHVALGTVRVEGTCAVGGQAAGTAAALAVRHRTTPRGVWEKHMDELQQTLLKNDQTIPEVPNRDPADLARNAAVTASSENALAPESRLGVRAKGDRMLNWQAANVVNGFAAPRADAANMWESSPQQTFPQWIELELKEPSRVGVVHCVFDTDLTLALGKQKEAFPAVCVRDYTLECRVNGEWKQVVRVRDNFQRFRRHRFAAVTSDRVRLTVEATHGAKTARVMELRVYVS